MCRFLIVSTLVLATAICGASPQEDARAVFENSRPLIPDNPIDRLVFKKLLTMEIKPVLCSDAVFVRRVYLDVIGKVPLAAEAAEFIDDPDTENKREALIDELLERSEFADYWSMKWSDTLRIKAEFPINLWPNAAQAYHRWVRSSIVNNKPYDQFVREMLTSSGSNFRVGPVNFYRAIQNKTPEGIAEAVALTFMGARADEWPAERLEGLTGFFRQVGYKPTAEWKEEFVFWDPLNSSSVKGSTAPGKAAITTIDFDNEVKEPKDAPARVNQPKAVFPDGSPVELSGDRDPREIFADWLITPQNPWFARNAANRVWAWLLGRGIVHEPDDFREDNPPSNVELLNWLGDELVSSGYDLKHLYRLILNSKTYQFSSVQQFDPPDAEKQFATYRVRRLDAEVLIDAINGITGTFDLYTSAIPEPFTYLPKEMPAVAIADGSITSPFLALFGRSARATGMSNERDNQTLAAQWLHMLNSSHIRGKLKKGPGLRQILTPLYKPDQIAKNLYLSILSRYPTEEETATIMAYGSIGKAPEMIRQATQLATKKSGRKNNPNRKNKSGGKNQRTPKQKKAIAKATQAKRELLRGEWLDIAWALFNSTEFLYRH